MYRILSGEHLSEEWYLKTWELDNRTFEEKDKITKEQALDWFYRSGKSTIVLIDCNTNKLVGYITPYLLSHSFSNDYIISNMSYKDALAKDVFLKPNEGVEGDIYIFSIVVEKEMRDIEIVDNKTAVKILTEALVEWIYEIKTAGVSINYVFSEKVSDEGEKYLKSLKLKKCFSLTDDAKYAGLFSPYMFEKCDNVSKLYDLYAEDNFCKEYDKSILNNHEYLSFKDDKLFYKDIDLLELTKKFGDPLEVAYLPMITYRIEQLKKLFQEKIEKYSYNNTYNYAYASKANYYSEVVITAFQSVDMIETSSAYDISIIVKLAELGIVKQGYTIICNGYKNKEYIENIKILLKNGIHVIPIIENAEEYYLLKEAISDNIDVGLRYNSDFEARLIKNDFADGEEIDNRFGFSEEDMLQMAERVVNDNIFNLKVFHFHFGGTISVIDNYIKGLSNIYEVFCKLQKKYNCFEYFDFGGGLPVKYSLTYSFNYDEFVDKMIKAIKELSIKNNMAEPKLIGEHGRYTVADHSFYIYKVDFAKKNWYVINGSLMNMTPDMWGINQDFTILPINLIQNKCIPVSLGGETCDPDDRYFLNNTNIKFFMPKINADETLYIAIFSIGAYQEIISGIGGVHHCMIPEGNELIIYKNKEGSNEYYKVNEKQTPEQMLDILDYNYNHINRFINYNSKELSKDSNDFI